MVKDTPTLSYCGQEVRKYDNDRFLTALFAPAGCREALFALYAFNVEVAKTREVVSEPLLGQIRLQWWRDAVGALYGEGTMPVHGVVQALHEAVTVHGLSRDAFDALIDARESDLDDEPPATLADLERYAAGTAVPLTRLALEALGVRDAAAHEAGRHAATGYALAGLLRAVPFHARQGRTLLPADRMAAHGATAREVLDFKPSPALRPVVAEVAAAARTHLDQARAARRGVAKDALPALLPAVLASVHLGVLKREGNDVFAARLHMPNPFRHARLAWAAFRGRY